MIPHCTSRSQSCGMACIERHKVCRQKLGAEASVLANRLARSLTIEAEKVLKLKAAGLTNSEAIAFSSYIGPKYRDMNRSLYAPETMTTAELAENSALAHAAAKGLQKLPSFTAADVQLYIDANQSNYAMPMSDDGLLTHSMRLEGAVHTAFAERHVVGDIVEAGKFLSTSWAQDGGASMFAQNANVQIKILPIDDGTGSGKAVDQYKNELIEDEILYHPATRFVVEAIYRQPDRDEITVNKLDVRQLQKVAEGSTSRSHMHDLMIQHYTPGSTSVIAALAAAKRGKMTRVYGHIEVHYRELPVV
jgi:hypothetical protein